MPNIVGIRDGLIVLSKYDEKAYIVAEHDELWAGHNLPPEKLEELDFEGIVNAGWHWDPDIKAWHAFV